MAKKKKAAPAPAPKAPMPRSQKLGMTIFAWVVGIAVVVLIVRWLVSGIFGFIAHNWWWLLIIAAVLGLIHFAGGFTRPKLEDSDDNDDDGYSYDPRRRPREVVSYWDEEDPRPVPPLRQPSRSDEWPADFDQPVRRQPMPSPEDAPSRPMTAADRAQALPRPRRVRDQGLNFDLGPQDPPPIDQPSRQTRVSGEVGRDAQSSPAMDGRTEVFRTNPPA